MDRTRALPPSISIAAHAAFASVLVLAPLVGPVTLPHASSPYVADLAPVLSIRLPGGGAPRIGRVGPPRVPSRSALAAPTSSTVIPLPEPISLDGDGLVPGFVDDPAGDRRGSGYCLSDCEPAVGRETGGAETQAVAQRAPYRIGGDIREPVRVRSVSPVYPPLALASHVEGRVVLDCVIEESGRVSDVAVLDGNPLLDAAAADAVRQWRYRPTLLNGVPVRVQLQVVVTFRLR